MRGLHVICEGADRDTVLRLANDVLGGGVEVVRLRANGVGEADRHGLARDVAASARAAGALGLLSDDLQLCLAVDAGGLHLETADLVGRGRALAAMRARLGDGRVLGVTVDDERLARAAAEAGADYLAVNVWRPATPPETRAIGLEGLTRIAASVDVPVVAMGGVHVGNLREVLDAGAAGVAVGADVIDRDDAVATARTLRRTLASGGAAEDGA